MQDPELGIIPKCVNHLFDELRCQKSEFTMRVSFLELYNEELFDLLSACDDMSKLRYRFCNQLTLMAMYPYLRKIYIQTSFSHELKTAFQAL